MYVCMYACMYVCICTSRCVASDPRVHKAYTHGCGSLSCLNGNEHSHNLNHITTTTTNNNDNNNDNNDHTNNNNNSSMSLKPDAPRWKVSKEFVGIILLPIIGAPPWRACDCTCIPCLDAGIVSSQTVSAVLD